MKSASVSTSTSTSTNASTNKEILSSDIVHVASQSTRFQILYALHTGSDYLGSLARKTGIPERTLSFHLNMLKEYGIIKTSNGTAKARSGYDRDYDVKTFDLTKLGHIAFTGIRATTNRVNTQIAQ